VAGGAGVETVYDGAGNDTCILGGGNDSVFVGAGNDTYDGGGGSKDTISFLYRVDLSSKGGNDHVQNTVGVTVSLSKTTAQTTAFGSDTIRGFENLTGGNGADKLTGNSAANELSGNGGNDTIYGLAGNDTLSAGAGKDTLIGGAGKDAISLLGDTTQMMDKVRYLKTSDSTATSFDTITFFKGGGTASSDRIDLSALLGSKQLVYHGTGAITTSAAGEVRWQLVDNTEFGRYRQ
jgi:Ca2+-binding RTX toxin-like protein